MGLKKLVLLGSVLFISQFAGAAIEVQVEITEVDHSKASRLGIQWLEKINLAEFKPTGILKVGSIDRLTALHADLLFLKQEGAAELLAKPNLLTDSGSPARFHAGGELPYITSSSLGSAHVEFKPFGVTMDITPKRLKSGRIRMKIETSVSAPDESNGVQLSGNSVPALLERKVGSTITVAPGATVTLAGLVQTQKDKAERGIPFLRKIPLLGVLFRWKVERFRRTSVIIFVTPKIIDI